MAAQQELQQQRQQLEELEVQLQQAREQVTIPPSCLLRRSLIFVRRTPSPVQLTAAESKNEDLQNTTKRWKENVRQIISDKESQLEEHGLRPLFLVRE